MAAETAATECRNEKRCMKKFKAELKKQKQQEKKKVRRARRGRSRSHSPSGARSRSNSSTSSRSSSSSSSSNSSGSQGEEGVNFSRRNCFPMPWGGGFSHPFAYAPHFADVANHRSWHARYHCHCGQKRYHPFGRSLPGSHFPGHPFPRHCFLGHHFPGHHFSDHHFFGQHYPGYHEHSFPPHSRHHHRHHRDYKLPGPFSYFDGNRDFPSFDHNWSRGHFPQCFWNGGLQRCPQPTEQQYRRPNTRPAYAAPEG